MTTTHTYYIGIDLSLSNTGIAIIRGTECLELYTITTDASKTFVERCQELYTELSYLASIYIDKPCQWSIEWPGGSQSARAGKFMAACTGVMASVVVQYELTNITNYTPFSIKKFVGSPEIKGTKRKNLNIQKADELYPEAPFNKNKKGDILKKDEHVADALLLAHMGKINF